MTIARVAAVIVVVAIAAVVIVSLRPPAEPTPPGGRPGEPTPGAAPVVVAPSSPVMLSVIGAVEDRFVGEPCNRIPGGGLFSVRAAVDRTKRFMPNVITVMMGDLTRAPGSIGRHTTHGHYSSVLSDTGIDVVCAGPGELGHGSDFARGLLRSVAGVKVLCANAIDSHDRPVLQGWALQRAGQDHYVLVVAVAAQSVADELANSESDVRLVDPIVHARKALDEAEKRAVLNETPPHSRVLLVHGTEDEAAEILTALHADRPVPESGAATPLFDVAAAADGPILPSTVTREVAGVTLLYPGRGARFLWRVFLHPGEPIPFPPALSRIGGDLLADGSPYVSSLAFAREATLHAAYGEDMIDGDPRAIHPGGDYAGAAACAECHADAAERHSRSPHAIAPKLLAGDKFSVSTGCSPCHTTGAFYRTGWKGVADASDLAGVSCEACHGPGAEHAADAGPGYGTEAMAACRGCHLPDRSPSFDPEEAWETLGHGPDSEPDAE